MEVIYLKRINNYDTLDLYQNIGDENMKPKAFISSTFYDLKYIREDLSTFITSQHYEPILFEDGNIGYVFGKPIDHSCYDAMKSCDMVILIVGGKYGSKSSDNDDGFAEYLSVTRKEFRTAIENHIPVFAFIDNKVYNEYEIYQKNISIINDNIPIAFVHTDNVNVFKFIDELKSTVGLPIFQFSYASDIKHILSEQFADMMKKYLASLRESKQIETLENTLQRIDSAINTLNAKINVVGEKLYRNNETFNFKVQNEISLTVEQAKMTHKAIVTFNTILKGIHLFAINNENKNENVDCFLSSMIKASEIISPIMNTQKTYDVQYFFNIISDCLAANNITASSMSSDLFRNFDDVYDALHNENIVNELKTMLVDNYDRLVMKKNKYT